MLVRIALRLVTQLLSPEQCAPTASSAHMRASASRAHEGEPTPINVEISGLTVTAGPHPGPVNLNLRDTVISENTALRSLRATRPLVPRAVAAAGLHILSTEMHNKISGD